MAVYQLPGTAFVKQYFTRDADQQLASGYYYVDTPLENHQNLALPFTPRLDTKVVLPQKNLLQPTFSNFALNSTNPINRFASLIYIGSSPNLSILPYKSTTKTGTKNNPTVKGIATGFDLSGVGSTDKVIVNKTDNCPTTRTYFTLLQVTSADNSAKLGRIFDKRDGTNNTQVEVLFVDQGSGRNRISFGGFFSVNGAWYTPSGSILSGNWYSVAVTYDRSSTSNRPTFYINGSLVTTAVDIPPSGGAVNNAAPYVIGNRASDNARPFSGNIACLYFFDTILTPEQIRSLSTNPWQIFNSNNPPIYYDLTKRVDPIALTTDRKLRFNNALGYYDPIDSL